MTLSSLRSSALSPAFAAADRDALPGLWQERLLLVVAGLFILTNHVALILVRARSVTALWHVAAWGGCALVGHVVLNRRVPARDPLLFPLVMLLSGWGLNAIARLAPGFADRQALWLAISVAALLGVTWLPANMRWLRRYRYTWFVGGLVLLVLAIVFGSNPSSASGPRLWIYLGVGRVYYQPSELLKLVLVVFLASYLAEHYRFLDRPTDAPPLGAWRLPSPVFLGPLLVMGGICAVLLVWQRDLGAATLFFAVALVMLYLASGRLALVVGGLAMLAAAGIAAYQLFDVVRLRVDIWFNPWPTADADAYQVVQSLMAVAAGGVFGQGIGQGQPQIIPVAHSDFIFAAIAEEWGALGALGILLVLAVVVVRGMRIAVMSRHPFQTLLAAGLSALVALQSLLIIGGALKLVPLTGVTLPFMSYGGSSLLTSFVAVGLLLVLSDGVARQVAR